MVRNAGNLATPPHPTTRTAFLVTSSFGLVFQEIQVRCSQSESLRDLLTKDPHTEQCKILSYAPERPRVFAIGPGNADPMAKIPWSFRFSDPDFAPTPDDRKSVSGHVYMLGGGPTALHSCV